MMGAWHQAVIDSLKQIPWVEDADEYPEKVTQLVTPAVFVDVPGWDKAHFADGQTRVTLKCDLFVVTDRAGKTENVPKPQIFARCLAMDLSDWIEGATFGLDNVDPAVFIDAEVDTFDRLLDDYIVFRVSFEQDIPVGEDPFAVWQVRRYRKSGWVKYRKPARDMSRIIVLSGNRRAPVMSLADEVAELRRRVADMVRRGVVDEVIPGSPVMVRVDIGDVLSPPLPWIQVQSGRYMQVSNYPSPGDAVTVISEAGDLRNGRVYPGPNIDAIPVPEGSEYEHVILFDTGTEIRYDRQANVLSITLAEGGSYKITGRGTLDGPVEITDTLTVQGKATMNAEAVVKADLMVGGEVSDYHGTMSQIRIVYNGHNHRGDSGGSTGQPGQQM